MTAVAPLAIPDADFVAILRTYNDVTERLKRSHETLAAEVQRLREELCEKNKQLARRERLAALGEMAAGVAHEIRNPLGGIGLYASLLERDLGDRPTQRDIAKRIGAGVESLEGIVRDILTFARGAEPVMEVVTARTAVDAAVAQAAARIDSMGIDLGIDEALDDAQLWCDSGQIERALANLIFNAIDAVGEGGRVWIRRSTSDSSGDGRVSIVVEDDGPGIPPEVASRIFDPFFTTKHHGTGLGLAIVHSIAEAHRGRVTAGNREGGGAAFVLSIPSRRAPAPGERSRRVIRRRTAACTELART
jgi:signal transduction histidine kinase